MTTARKEKKILIRIKEREYHTPLSMLSGPSVLGQSDRIDVPYEIEIGSIDRVDGASVSWSGMCMM